MKSFWNVRDILFVTSMNDINVPSLKTSIFLVFCAAVDV